MRTGAATKVRMQEAETYSKKLHKRFEPAFILDSFSEERENEMTIDTTRAEIKHKDLAFALIDVPGHEELIKNMISGASYGEIALLLVSAKKGEGIKDQTKRHLFIARMLGINKLIVAVNKMDLAGYSKETFDNIKKGLMTFIEKIGFSKENVNFVPISAYKGENLVKKSSNMKWYKGNALLEALYANAKSEEEKKEGPLRIIVQGALDAENKLVAGKIVSGSLKTGEKLVFEPIGEEAIAKDITVKGKKVKNAEVGENVALALSNKINSELRGTVISSINDKPRITDSLKSLIFVTGKIGNKLMIKFNGIDIGCKGIKISNVLNTVTGEKEKSTKPRFLEAVNAEILISRKIPVENYDVTRELGRFILYSGGAFCGIGIVNAI